MSRPRLYVVQLAPRGQEFVAMSPNADSRWMRCPQCGSWHDTHDPADYCLPSPFPPTWGRVAVGAVIALAVAVVILTAWLYR